MQVIKQKTNSKKKALSLIIGGLFVLLCIYLAASWALDAWPFKNDSNTKAVIDQKTIDSNSVESPKEITVVPENTIANENKSTDEVPVNKSLGVKFTQLEQSGEFIIFKATIKNSPKAGICAITFSNPNDKPVTREIEATVKDGVAICGSSDISVYDFSYLGKWIVSLRYYIDGEQVTTEGEVTIQ